MSFFRKSGIVNVKMVITEEKIVSNIDKIQKLISPNSKKQIVQLDEDTYFKGLVESVKNYLIEYPKKSNFPLNVYKAAYELVEFSTNQFEENTKKVETLIRKREKNIKKASVLTNVLKVVKSQPENCKSIMKKVRKKYSKDIIEALKVVATAEKKSDEYISAVKLIKTQIGNLENNTFIEIDMERIEDKSKALSYIGIEIAESLNEIPVPAKFLEEQESKLDVGADVFEEETDFLFDESANTVLKEVIEENIEQAEENEIISSILSDDTSYRKRSLFDKIKESKFVRAIKYITKIRVRVELPALPEGRG